MSSKFSEKSFTKVIINYNSNPIQNKSHTEEERKKELTRNTLYKCDS